MSCSCGCSAGSACSCGSGNLSPYAQARSLAAQLSGVVDCARKISVDLGLRPYQTTLIWTSWSGERRGEGVEDVIRCVALEPTPLVLDMAQVRQNLRPVGLIEDGSVRVTQISSRYDEDVLMGRWCGTCIPADQNFYWEIKYPQADKQVILRRFFPYSVPTFSASKFQWTVDLKKVAQDRTREGEPVG